MSNKIKRSEAIKKILDLKTHADIAKLYNKSMEVQVNVAQDGGKFVDGDYKGKQWRGWTDGATTWKPFRIPYNAKTRPEDNDYDMTYDLEAHAEGIGMTGWNWEQCKSIWVAYDFDAISGHSEKHGKKLTEVQLDEVRKAVEEIPWVTLRLSTSGKGLHVYVFLQPVDTNNHNEHAALARAILGMMSSKTGFDFKSKVDICGGNMWVWHRKMIGTKGLTLLKQGGILTEIPPNWQDHLTVVRGERKKIIPQFIAESDHQNIQDMFDEICSQKTRVELDEEHKKLINWMSNNEKCGWWSQDHHMLVTHTYVLKEAYDALKLKGIYRTMSEGRDQNTQNCFMYPLRNGAWSVRRYTPGVAEDSTWTQDGQGWTTCFFNREPTLDIVSRAFGGIEHKGGGYVFPEGKVAIEAAKGLGIKLDLPEFIITRRVKMKHQKDGKLLVEIPHDPQNDRPDMMKDWLAEKKLWTQLFRINTPTSVPEGEQGNYDNVIRHLITETGEDYGWVLNNENEWKIEPFIHIKTYLSSLALSPKEVTSILGSCIAKCWKIVCKPFEAEYPQGTSREWNMNAPQFRWPLNQNIDDLKYTTWMKILDHCGKSLDEALKHNQWAQSNYVYNGADYLKCWISSLFKEPLEPLPYLFFYGPQNSGKSIFHEAISLLITRGVVRADNALINPAGFNGELEEGLLCVVEETDMHKNKLAYNRIKDWVTAPYLSMHKKQRTPYSVRNFTHWVQTANDYKSCPITIGDSRITMMYVDTLSEEQMIPKKQLIPLLEKEASDFLTAIMHLELPSTNDRLNIPVIVTEEKTHAQKTNLNDIEAFIDEKCYLCEGHLIKFSEFYDKFIEWLDPNEVSLWSKIRLGRELPLKYGRYAKDLGQRYIANVTWNENKENVKPTKKWLVKDEHLIQE